MKPDNILIVGGGLQALSVAYSLWKIGQPAICIASKEEEIRHSRFITKFYAQQSADITDQLFAIIRDEQVKLAIPMSDGLAEWLSKHKTQLEQDYGCRVPVPDYDTFIVAADKSRLMAFCEQENLPHPRTRRLTADNLAEAADYVRFPALIKPDRSVGARGIKIVRTLDELQQHYPSIAERYGNSTLQEYIDSKDKPYYNVMLYRNADGKITGQTIIEILRYYPIQGGSSSLCRTIEAPQLLAICTHLLNKLNWVGMADFDVLKNQHGEYKIIEINPRVPASLRAADCAGVNFPQLMWHEAIGKPAPACHYKQNKYLRYLGLDLMWFLHSPKRWCTKPNWFFSLGPNTFFQDIYAKDPATWFSWLTNGFKRFLKKRKHIQ